MNSTATRPTVGFIGVGLMGHGMAKNIVTKGYRLVVLGHRNREPVEHLKTLGATEARTPRELAAQCDIVHLCVTGSPQVEANLRGPDGVIAGGRPGLVVIDCSTSNPVSTLALGDELRAAGMTLVDAAAWRIRRYARCAWARCKARATSARRWAGPTCWPVAYRHALAEPSPGRTRMGRPRPLPALARPLRHRALRRADRGRRHPRSRARDLRQRRQPPADVGHGQLHAGHGDLRRLARPGPGPSAWAWRWASSRRRTSAFVYNSMSDGELDEGSTWEAAMGAAHHRLDNLICLVDINNQQADGPSSR
jgi:hypothetical protein